MILKKISFICEHVLGHRAQVKRTRIFRVMGKRMQLDERELRRHPHGTIQVVTSSTPKLTQISVEVKN